MNALRTPFLVLAFLATAVWSESAGGPKAKSAKGKDATAKKPKGHFTIGKGTTYVTGPLDKDGYIGYAAALNKRLRKGVTPANNANVLLWKAMGPRPEGGRPMPPEFFRWMGIQAPPEKGRYYINLYQYRKEHLKIDLGRPGDDIDNQWDRVTQRPWTPEDYPDIASWLKANEKPLALVVQASKRPQFYSPLVSGRSSGLIAALLPGVQKCRDFASALVIRAMLRIGQGNYDDAWQDLLACHRLGRLVMRGGTLIEALVGIAIDSVAARADLVFLDRAKLRAQQVKSCLRDLHKLPPLAEIADKMSPTDRFMLLETVMMVDRYGIKHLEYIGAVTISRPPKNPGPLPKRILEGIDWDPALRNANRWYDRLVAAMREKDRGSRKVKLDQIEMELKALKKKVVDSGGLAQLSTSGKKAKGKVIVDILVSLMMPAVAKVLDAVDRTRQVQANISLALALAWYQREHGHYPKKLAALAPEYLPEIPGDMFSGKPLIYRPARKGYLLYSVGVNGNDEGGRGYDDKPPGDDLSVRMPLPKSRGN
jgi:hypothetical protein